MRPTKQWAENATRQELEDKVISLTTKLGFLLEMYIEPNENGGFRFRQDGEFWDIYSKQKGGFVAVTEDDDQAKNVTVR